MKAYRFPSPFPRSPYCPASERSARHLSPRGRPNAPDGIIKTMDNAQTAGLPNLVLCDAGDW